MERHGEAIIGYQLKLIDTGITYQRTLPGLVPEIEERDAARFGGYTWKGWTRLARQERIDGLAYARICRQIELHGQDAQNREAERRVKRTRNK